ncbi:TPA: cell cycle [Trebouxia sp. C0006]
MDAALLTTVEQLSDDGPANRGAPWPAGVLVTSPQSGQPALSADVQVDSRDPQNGAMEPNNSGPVAASTVEPSQLESQGVAWRGAPQERLLDWSSSLASQHLSDEAPGVFTITDRKVRGGDDPLDIPIYSMCRRWVRNDPYNDEAHMTESHSSTEALFTLPDPLPAQTGADSPYPIEGPLPTLSNGEPDAEYLLEHHMNHWLKVREHHVKKISRKSDRYRMRLKLLLQKTHPGDFQELTQDQPDKQQPMAAGV